MNYPFLRGTSIEKYGECPKCGGKDRFHAHHIKGFFCRKCVGEPGGGGRWIPHEDYDSWLEGKPLERRFVKIDNKIDDTIRLKARAKLRRSNFDKVYHSIAMRSEEAIEEWGKKGLNEFWMKVYGLGFRNNPRSLVIPYYKSYLDNGSCEQSLIHLIYRLLDSVEGGKYRPYCAGLGKPLFRADIFMPNLNKVILVEGEIKAMVTYAFIQDNYDGYHPDPLPRYSVVGISGKCPGREVSIELRNASEIIINLDPDANFEAEILASSLGEKRCKVVYLPDKIDDLITGGMMEYKELVELLL